jgi:hypothetical protein
MNHIFGIYIWSIISFFCFGICLLLFAHIGLDYYITNNTFNDIVISILIKLYNITCACFFIQDYIFQTKELLFFFEKTLPYMHNFNFDGFKQYQSWTLLHKNNKSHHKCKKKKTYFFNKLISFQLHLSFQNPKCSNTQTKVTIFS